MASPLLPDSNYYINCARAGLDPFDALGDYADAFDFLTCGMVILEVIRGRSDPNRRLRFQQRFALMLYIPTTNQVWERASQLAWALDRKGIILPAQDIVIASHALHADATVLTYDAHFSAIPGLRVTDHLG